MTGHLSMYFFIFECCSLVTKEGRRSLTSESFANVTSWPQNWRDCPPLYIFFSLNIVHLVRRIGDNCNLSTESMELARV